MRRRLVPRLGAPTSTTPSACSPRHAHLSIKRLEGAGHGHFLETAQQFNEACLGFLSLDRPRDPGGHPDR